MYWLIDFLHSQTLQTNRIKLSIINFTSISSVADYHSKHNVASTKMSGSLGISTFNFMLSHLLVPFLIVKKIPQNLLTSSMLEPQYIKPCVTQLFPSPLPTHFSLTRITNHFNRFWIVKDSLNNCIIEILTHSAKQATHYTVTERESHNANSSK